MNPQSPATVRAGLIALGLALVALPAFAQENKMEVTPATIAIARGETATFAIRKNIGQGWQASSADEWYTLVEPQKLGVFKIVGGALVFEAEMEGTGELHIWHKSRLSGAGLYAKVPATVRPKATAPVRATPQPAPPTSTVPASTTPSTVRPATPVATGATLDVFQMGRLPPTWLDPARDISIAPGEVLVLGVVKANEPTRALDLVPAAEPGLIARVEPGRVVVQLQRGTPAGQAIELALRCRATGASTRLRFIAEAVGAPPAAVRVWVRRGFEGAWQLLAADGAIALRPGGVVFISAEAVCAAGRPAAGAVELAMATSPDFALRPIGSGLWILVSGAPTRFDVRGAVTATVAGSAVARAITVAFGE